MCLKRGQLLNINELHWDRLLWIELLKIRLKINEYETVVHSIIKMCKVGLIILLIGSYRRKADHITTVYSIYDLNIDCWWTAILTDDMKHYRVSGRKIAGVYIFNSNCSYVLRNDPRIVIRTSDLSFYYHHHILFPSASAWIFS